MEMMLNKIVPEGLPYRHSCEGPDDMVRKPNNIRLLLVLFIIINSLFFNYSQPM